MPVIFAQKGFDKLRDSWSRRNSTLTREFYNKTFDNVRKMKEKYPNRILIIRDEDLMEHPDVVMSDVFHHVGLQWRTEYLQMEGLLKSLRTTPSLSKSGYTIGSSPLGNTLRVSSHIGFKKLLINVLHNRYGLSCKCYELILAS